MIKLSILEKREKKASYQKRWRKNNPDRSKELSLIAQSKKPEYYKEMAKKKYLRWKKDHPERLKAITSKASKKFAAKKTWLIPENRVKSALRVKKWIKNNPEGIKIIRKRAKAKRKGVVGSYSLGDWEHLKALYSWTCPSCRCKEPKIILHADHIVPISQGGDNNIDNIQPLCKSCNSRKYTKTIRYPRTTE